MGYKGKNDREKVRIELAARFIGAPDRRLQNRQWAKTDAMTSVFVHYRKFFKIKGQEYLN